ncbi:MAG: trehalose-phosphatase [Mobilicoccus sp.]|nr:trehalose-phosphatase [Mobilicoccus sp.]
MSGTSDDDEIVLIGSHGAQSSADIGVGALLDEDARARLALLDTALQEVQARHPQSRIERKPAAVALHTRGLPEDVERESLADAARLGDRDGVHALAGKSVVELSVVSTSKGVALRSLARLVQASCVVYVGDDVTDEKAFAELPADEGHVTVKVGEGDTLAAYRVEDIPDVPAIIETFVRSRRDRFAR